MRRLRRSAIPGFVVTAVLSGAAAAETPPAARPPAALPTAVSAPAALWRLPGSAESMRLEGEDARLRWPVFMPARAAQTITRFQLGYLAAISVMPEASWITVSINGQLVGRMPISAPTATKVLSFDIAPGLLSPGWNAVEIGTSQRHRVDCSQAATYELWTKIENSKTGFVGEPPGIATLDDLPAVAVDGTGATPLHLILPPNPSPDDLGRAVRVVERVALRGHYLHPVVDTRPDATGLQIAVATTAGLDPAVRAALGGSSGGGVRLARTAAGTPILVVSAAGEAELDRAIDEFDPLGADPKGTSDGLAALAGLRGMRIAPGGTLTFVDLGLKSRSFTGRLYREAFDVTLPPDAYLADYGEARLSLDGGYAAGLNHDARLLVRVNGVVDGSLDLDRPGGAVLQGQTIHMPSPRSGRVATISRSRRNCRPARMTPATRWPRSMPRIEFLLLGTSALSVPMLARVAQFPNLSAAFVGNFRVTPSAASRLVLPRATAGPIGAAATLLANAALSTGAPSDTVVLRGLPQGDDKPALVVETSSDVTAPLLASAGIDAGAVSAAWPAGAPPAQRRPGSGVPRRIEEPAGRERQRPARCLGPACRPGGRMARNSRPRLRLAAGHLRRIAA